MGRSVHGSQQSQEFFVPAVEIVTFGSLYFFRCLEKPTPFLLPMSDYIVLEVKETLPPLKISSPEKGGTILYNKSDLSASNTETALKKTSKKKSKATDKK